MRCRRGRLSRRRGRGWTRFPLNPRWATVSHSASFPSGAGAAGLGPPLRRPPGGDPGAFAPLPLPFTLPFPSPSFPLFLPLFSHPHRLQPKSRRIPFPCIGAASNFDRSIFLQILKERISPPPKRPFSFLFFFVVFFFFGLCVVRNSHKLHGLSPHSGPWACFILNPSLSLPFSCNLRATQRTSPPPLPDKWSTCTRCLHSSPVALLYRHPWISKQAAPSWVFNYQSPPVRKLLLFLP